MGLWQLLRKAKELWSWYSFAAGATTLLVSAGAVVIAALSTTWAWYWQTFSWAGVAFAFLVSWLVIAFGIFLIGTGVLRWRGGTAPTTEPKTPPKPSPLEGGLYVADMRLTFHTLSDRHCEITMRVFNGTGRTVEFFGLSGHIKFNAPNNTDSSRMGDLPTPSTRADMAKTIAPFQEWLLILEQRIPAPEADKLLAMLAENIPIHFDLHELTIEVRAQDDQQQSVHLPIWGGVSYSHGNGFGQIVYLSARSIV
jgi:hypothetical protein